MTLTDAQSWVLIIVACSGAIVSIITAMKTHAQITVTDQKVQDTNEKVVRVSEKVDEVHTVTNRNFTEQKQTIELLRGQINSLLKEATLAEAARAHLAEAAARALAETSSTLLKP